MIYLLLEDKSVIMNEIREGDPNYYTCYYCGRECNPCSVACERCMRDVWINGTLFVSEQRHVPKVDPVPKHFVPTILAMKKEDRTCPICTEVIDDDIYITSCYHLFHVSCIEKCLEKKQECPTCRNQIKEYRL